MATISVEGMEFFAYHGCFHEEQIIGNRFLVDIFAETDTSEAEVADDLSKTLNYQKVFVLSRDEMEVKSRLIEHVARRILNRLMKEHPEVTYATIKLSKMNPPVGGRVERVAITLSAKR